MKIFDISISQNNPLTDSYHSDPTKTQGEDNSKQLGRTPKLFGVGCLLITLCCMVGYIGIEVTNVLSTVSGPSSIDSYPKWSPDGSRISFVSYRDGNADIYMMNADGSKVKQLTKDPFAIFSFMASASRDKYPSWSPDGKKILFSSERDDSLWSVTNLNTYMMDADGSNEVRLAQKGNQGVPTWSPDGQHIILSISGGGHYDEEIYTMYADGSNLKRLTYSEKDDSYPSWSPDGTHILFAAERDGNWDIYVMDADASNQIRLTEHVSLDIEPAWSPDGKHIVFSSDRNGNWDIYSLAADGSDLTLLTDDPADDRQPSWSPNGELIAFSSDRDGDFEIFVMDADGSNVIQLTFNE